MKNTITYSSLSLKVFDKTIETLKNIEENTTNLNTEQKSLIQKILNKENIDTDAHKSLIEILTERIREELYSFLINKGLTNGLATLDRFKGFNRNDQLKELKKVKDIVAKRKFTGVNNPGTRYEDAINEYKTKEDKVYRNYAAGFPVQNYATVIENLVNWLKNII